MQEGEYNKDHIVKDNLAQHWHNVIFSAKCNVTCTETTQSREMIQAFIALDDQANEHVAVINCTSGTVNGFLYIDIFHY